MTPFLLLGSLKFLPLLRFLFSISSSIFFQVIPFLGPAIISPFAKVGLSVAIHLIKGHYFLNFSHSGPFITTCNYLSDRQLIIKTLYLITFRESESPPESLVRHESIISI